MFVFFRKIKERFRKLEEGKEVNAVMMLKNQRKREGREFSKEIVVGSWCTMS